MEAENSYHPPVNALLRHNSEPFILEENTLPNYVQELGLTPADIPELTRLVTDTQFDTYEAHQPEWSAPLRAAHALAQLSSEDPQAIAALISLFDQEDRWLAEDLVEIIVPIGPAVVTEYLLEYLNNGSKPEFSRMLALDCLYEIARDYPETQDRFRQELVACLEKYMQNPPGLNGFLISYLIKLKAVETAPLMEAAYKADRVDPRVVGPWASVQVDLGLKQASDFTPEELRVPLLGFPKYFQELNADDLLDQLESKGSSKPKLPYRGFGGNTPPKTSKKKSKKRK